MILEKTVRIRAPRQKVWNTLMDVPFIVSCIPGLEKVEAAGDNRYRALFKVKVAYISATFDMTITIANAREPEYLETVAEGNGLLGAGRVKQNQTIELKAISEMETEAVYKGEYIAAGKLAILGEKAINIKVNEYAERFVGDLIAKCEGIC